jgi:hypothetical protein
MRCRLLSIVLALLAAGLLLACAAQRPKDAAATNLPKAKIVVMAVTSKPELNNKGRLSGKVVDQELIPVIGARIKVLDPQGKLAGRAATDINGQFITAPLPPSTYSIFVEATGFCKAEVDNIIVAAGSNTVLQCKIIADPAHRIVIVDGPPMIDTRSTTAGAVITESETGQIYVDPY